MFGLSRDKPSMVCIRSMLKKVSRHAAKTFRRIAPVLALTAATASLANTSFEVELDPYYSNAGLYIGLTDKPIPEITEDQETRVYHKMLSSITTVPRFMLFELSVNPLPVLGVYTKKNHRDFYDSFGR